MSIACGISCRAAPDQAWTGAIRSSACFCSMRLHRHRRSSTVSGLFSTLFRLGLLLGRFGSLSAQMTDAEPEQQRLLQAGSFWAEVDMAAMLHEVALRYMSAEDMDEAPPTIAVHRCETGEEAFASVSAFADWILRAFVGEKRESSCARHSRPAGRFIPFSIRSSMHGRTIRRSHLFVNWRWRRRETG